MKNLKSLLALLLLVGCSNNNDFGTTIFPQNDIIEESHFVTLNDVQALQRAQTTETRSVLNNKFSVKCLKDETNDTLLYIVNHPKGGWTIYASDTRVPAILAQSSEGTYEEASENDNLTAWVGTMAEDMKIIKHLDDSGLSFSSEEIKHNQKFWKAISKPDEYIAEEETGKTRFPRDFVLLKGHYELRYSRTYSEVYDSIPRLTTTIWGQEHPYNDYCPNRTDIPNEKALAGCVAIAGAQMLYFLHYKLGIPETAPSWATCDGNINSYTMKQGGYSVDIWNKIKKNYDIASAPLVANVGSLLNMQYGNDGSYADFGRLQSTVFPSYGITCTHSTYNVSELCKSLQEDMPVIISAFAYLPDINTTRVSFNSQGNKKEGHSFIADRYKREHQITENVYEWVYDTYTQKPDGTYIPIPYVDDKIEYVYFSPEITMIGFNWGWGNKDNYDDKQWFTLTGNWIRKNYEGDWSINKSMIYNFKAK